jgi:hypothetical protein
MECCLVSVVQNQNRLKKASMFVTLLLCEAQSKTFMPKTQGVLLIFLFSKTKIRASAKPCVLFCTASIFSKVAYLAFMDSHSSSISL